MTRTAGTAWSGERRRRWALAVAMALTALPFAVLAVMVLVSPRSAPLGDQALVQLRVADVGSLHTPLVGSYQKLGWNQPGPAFFYLLAVPYRLFGASYAALQVGAVLLGALAVAGAVAVALRRGGALLALWTMALLGVLWAARGPTLLSDPWEPRLSVLALVLLALVVMDLALGRAWELPVTVALATVVAQAWATTTLIAAVLLGWGVLCFAWGWPTRLRSPDDPPPQRTRGAARRPAIVAALVLVVLWLPPLVQQLHDHPGNITLMWRFLTGSHDTFGPVAAYRLVAINLGFRGPWMGFGVPLHPFVAIVDEQAGPIVPVALVVLLAAGAFAGRRRDPSFAFAATALVMVLAAIAAFSRLVGGPIVEVIEPTNAVGLTCWLAAGWCLMSSTRGAVRTRTFSILVPVLAVVVAGLGVANTVAAAGGVPGPTNDERAVRELSDRAVAPARRVHGPVLVGSSVHSPQILGGDIGPQLLALTLDRAGIDVRVDSGGVYKFGAFRARPAEARAEMRLTFAADPPGGRGWHRIAVVDPLSRAERAERQRLDAELDAAFGSVTGRAAQLRELARRPRLRALRRERDSVSGAEPLALWMRPLGRG